VKTLVLGLDGIGDDIWGLPGGDLVEHHGRLETFYTTFPSFMCSITGKRYKQTRLTAHRVFRKDKFIWDYLGDMRQTYINIPPTYPAELVNGSFICGFMGSRLNSNSVCPPSLVEDLRKDVDYRFAEELDMPLALEGRWNEFFEAAMGLIEMRTRTIKYLTERDQSELLFAVYTASDECLHQRVEGRLGERRIREMKKFLLENVIDVVDTLQPDTTIFFSDHGFNMRGYHGDKDPETRWGTWGLNTVLDHLPPRKEAHILDVFPTILSSMDVEYSTFEGCSLVYAESDKRAMIVKLRRLGYI